MGVMSPLTLLVSICLIGQAKSECSWSNRPIDSIAEGKATCVRLLQAAELSSNFYASCEIQEVEPDGLMVNNRQPSIVN